MKNMETQQFTQAELRKDPFVTHVSEPEIFTLEFEKGIEDLKIGETFVIFLSGDKLNIKKVGENSYEFSGPGVEKLDLK